MIFVAALALLLFGLIGAPLFAVILGAAMLGMLSQEIDLAVIAIELYRIADTPMLMSLPLFAYAGYVLAESGTSQRLVRMTSAFIGWMPSGLAIVAFIACAIFTAFTGASGVTIVALGAILYPALKQAGYGDRYSLGLVTSSGSLGLLIVPSVPLILYGVVAQQMELPEPFSIRDLFVAGLLPALLMIVLLAGWSVWHHRGGRIPVTPFSGREAWTALKEAKWEIPLPFVVLGGIYGGYFVVSEAAAVTALYVTIVEVAVYREVTPRQLVTIMRDSMVMVGAILLILGASLAFTSFLVDAELPQRMFEIVSTHIHSKIAFLILLNIGLLLLGAILDIFSALFIMIPLILPVALGYGIHPVHLGIIFLANMQIGYFTPPIGMNLFIASYRFDKSITELYLSTLPFMLVLLIALMIITYVPELSLFLIDSP
jgi:tripartite ATP-independent transporter DctM subunit